MESSSGSVDDFHVKNDEVKTPPIPQFVKYCDKITNICKICYDDSIPAHVSCVTCNQKYHIQCLTRLLYEKCPTCRTVWHSPTTIDNLGDIALVEKKKRLLIRLRTELSEQLIEFNGGIRWDARLKIFKIVKDPHSFADKRYIESLRSGITHIEHEVMSLNHKLKIIFNRA